MRRRRAPSNSTPTPTVFLKYALLCRWSIPWPPAVATVINGSLLPPSPPSPPAYQFQALFHLQNSDCAVSPARCRSPVRLHAPSFSHLFPLFVTTCRRAAHSVRWRLEEVVIFTRFAHFQHIMSPHSHSSCIPLTTLCCRCAGAVVIPLVRFEIKISGTAAACAPLPFQLTFERCRR